MLLLQEKHIVPAIWPVDLNTGANPGDYVSLKNYGHCTVNIILGTAAGTCVVTLKQATSVAGAAEKALSFLKYYMTGVKLKTKTKTGLFQAGETVTGAGGGIGYVFKDYGEYVLLYTVNITAFVDDEVLTGGTTGYTAKAVGIGRYFTNQW